MNKLKKSLMYLILFLMYANNIYATTTGTYVVSDKSSGAGKFFLLIVGAGLVSLVLFVGYMMDKNENTKRKREKFIKKQSNSDIFSRNYRDNKVDEWVEKYKVTNNDDEIEDEYEETDEEDENQDESNYYTQEIKFTREYDEDEKDESKVEDLEKNLVENYIDEEDDYEEKVDDKYEESKEDIIIEDNDYKKSTDIVELMNSTMVFNSDELRNEETLNNNSVKGYDYEDDEDLSELEEIIKAANIKRYTRKKQPGNKLPVRKRIVVFTKAKDENDIISQTRKKIEEIKESQKPKRGRPPKNKDENEKDSQEVKVPAKRGRKPGSKNKPKEPAKRGRKPGSKNKTTSTGKKRGRPPKKDTETKGKRGRPPKNK